ncbi:hypothetical protein HYV11_02865 [Candidatus Dependentiae bacterium]|nr:hypothetical protein [Candidatus Dependentiae bacterium]
MEKNNSFLSRFSLALVKNNVMQESEAESFIKEFRGRGKGNIVSFLLEEGLVEEEDVLRALASMYDVPSFDVRGHFFNHELLVLFQRDFLKKHVMIPLEIDEDILTVVMGNPEDEKTLEEISNYVNYNITVLVGIQEHILEAITEYYEEDVITVDVEELQKDKETDEDDSDIIDYF